MMALRVGLVRQDQLIAGLHAWVDSKGERIEEILIQLGFVTRDACELLTPLVESFLNRHHGNANAGLAELSSIGGLKAEIAAINDSDLHEAIQHLPKEDSDEPGSTLAYSPQEERFRILSFHRKGGLGKVSIALDNEVGRPVAFKEIREEFAADPTSRERFLLEAEVTGRLEHPGIVPVYGLGHYQDGRPFYAMRFIRGDTFKSSIRKFHNTKYESSAQRRSDFRRLLERFLDVCEAIDYAHARGVLHRDLKPGNIMLGRYGETLVVDWGLAKTIERKDSDEKHEEETLKPRYGSGTASLDGLAIGSPAYMSPEQAHGRLDELGPQTDVFGLGATLYYLLTGQPPYGSDGEEDTLEKAKQGRIVPPIDIVSGTPSRLSEICLIAMATRKENRYESARQLREDLWQWLSNEPISTLLAAVNYFEELNAKEPKVHQYKIRLARELSNLSKVYQSLERLDEAFHASKRSVALLDEIYARNQLNLAIFQELYFARTQLSSVLRIDGRDDEATRVDEANQEQFQSLLRSLPKNGSIRDELFNLTLHQGFSPKEAQELLETEQESRIDKEMRPEGIDDETTLSVFVDDEAPPMEMPRHVDLENRYSLMSLLGQGGAGSVYLAKDNLLPRHVAIKISRGTNRDYAKHLLRESAIMALLGHANIVPIYDAGYRKDTNDPFLVMKFIDGEDWKQVRERFNVGRLRSKHQWTDLLQGFPSICDAVEHAHQLGIVHGDPKPANVIVDAWKRPWLFDWGLSRVVNEMRLRKIAEDVINGFPDELSATLFEGLRAVSVIGTPAFMSPEQAKGDGISEKTDIYVLGASLYYLLTGQPPFRNDEIAGDWQNFFQRVRSGDFRKPREIERRIPRDLETICLKALATEPGRRFDSAGNLGSAIRSKLK